MENEINTATRFRPLRPLGGSVFWLAIVATATALSLSILAGWQRGGTLPERVVWVAIGVVLVVSAHLLPALIRDSPIIVRGVGSVLWVACLATACYGHVVFFVLAQQHAGERRAFVVAVAPPAVTRSLTVVMAERAAIVRQLARLDARRCSRVCAERAARRAALAAKLDALNAEADDVRRQQAADDRVASQRDALRADPVTSGLAVLLGTTAARIDLLTGLVFAAVLEGVACLLWTIALRSPPVPTAVAAVTDTTPAVVAPVASRMGVGAHAVAADHVGEAVDHNTAAVGHATATVARSPRDDPIALVPDRPVPEDDVTRLARDVAAGRVRPTVADIRIHLGCSQARALALRRQLAERHLAA